MLAIIVLSLGLAACGDDDDSAASRRYKAESATAPRPGAPSRPASTHDLEVPKQLGNPYEEIEHNGVTVAMTEARRDQTRSGWARPRTPAPHRRSRSSIRSPSRSPTRGSSSPATTPTPSRRRLKKAAEAGIKIVAMDSDVAPDGEPARCSSPGLQERGDRPRSGPPALRARSAGPVGRSRSCRRPRTRQQPERVDQVS